jgi:repressor LexA
MAPTQKQTQVLEAIKFLIKKTGESPTVREVGALVGLSSSATVHKHLDALEREGLIYRTEKGRIRLHDAGPELPERSIPIMGRIAAGQPIEAVAEAGTESSTFPVLAIDPHFFTGSGDLMALRVSGDSMIEAGILDGDYVIIRRQPLVEEGEIAAVDVDGEVTLKRWQRQRLQGSEGAALEREGLGDAPVRLVPANARFEPIEITADDQKEVRVLGKYVGLVRGEIHL